MAELELRSRDGAVELGVWAKPRASKSRLLGVRNGQLEVALAAPPVDGAANEELIRVLASHFGIPRSQVELVAGQAGRTKRVRLLGLAEPAVRALIPP
jgi:uncharacterized protein (TIGR00251 family)